MHRSKVSNNKSAPARVVFRGAQRSFVVAVVIALSGAIAAYGSTAPASKAPSTSSGFPVRVTGTSGSATINKKPTRIVSLSPTMTDMLFAIGAGPQVVAVDDDSTYPANAPKTTLSGLTPNVEAIAKYRPNLVVISYTPSGFVAALTKLGIPVLYEDAATTLTNSYAQITTLGRATGNVSGAAKVVATMQHEIASDVADAPHFSPALTYYYELGEPSYYSATSSTFIGSVLALFGMKNVADGASGASSGYPQLQAEYIVKSDPDVIFLADTICCGQSLKTVSARPGWSAITAVHDGAVVGLNDNLASQWGPHIVDLVGSIRAALVTLKSHGER